MGTKITYERWINLFLPDGWTEREEMGYILLEKENWPGMVQLTFIVRDEKDLVGENNTPPEEAAKILLEDILEDRDIPFPREAVIVENKGNMGMATVDYTHAGKEESTHWRIWMVVDKTRAFMAAYISNPEHDAPHLVEASRIIADIEFIPDTND